MDCFCLFCLSGVSYSLFLSPESSWITLEIDENSSPYLNFASGFFDFGSVSSWAPVRQKSEVEEAEKQPFLIADSLDKLESKAS